ncbi:hypothetical protein ACFY0A_35590 [Streptomyces sp. NPDC001698]|uniref:hypothetical protein n=1 Tax=Streptomyces sp. NPDC001698 TaxID=3364601 RepID=UPI0036C90DE2
MDPITLAAARAAADVLVRAMSTDAWQQVQALMVRLWRWDSPDKLRMVEAELSAARQELLASRGDVGGEGEIAAEWYRRIRRLVQTHPEALDELQQILDEVLTVLPPAEQVTNVRWQTNSGDSRVFQAGRSQPLTGRNGSEVGNTPPGPPLGDDDDEW